MPRCADRARSCQHSLGISRINHILRVHGESLTVVGALLQAFDDWARSTLDRLFPGLSDEGHEQTTLAAAKGGLGLKRARDSALAANLSALVMATPKVHSMAQAAIHAGLVHGGQIERELESTTARCETAYLSRWTSWSASKLRRS